MAEVGLNDRVYLAYYNRICRDAIVTLTLAKWTLDKYQQLVETGLLDQELVELINGEIVEMPPEGPEHAYRNTSAADRFRTLLGDRAHIRDAKPITLPAQTSEPQPDIAIVAPHRPNVA